MRTFYTRRKTPPCPHAHWSLVAGHSVRVEQAVDLCARAPQPASRAHPHECRTGAMTSAMGAFACSIGRLSLGNMPSTEYTLRQRVALVLEASVTAETLVAMPDADIHHAFLMEQGISPTLLRAAQVTPLQLKAHGTRHGRPSWPRSGSPRCTCWTRSGARTPSRRTARPRCSTSSWPRATTPWSSRARPLGRASWASTWGCCCCVCAERAGRGARGARAVPATLRRVPPETLLETGLRAEDLAALGLSKARLRQDTLATDAQLSLLGF